MPTEVKLPELGENVTSGDLVKLLVAVGDTVKKDQPILELETEKASIEVPSPADGTVQELHVKQGQKIEVGTLILTLEDGAAKAEKPAEKKKEEEPAEEEKPAKKPAAKEKKEEDREEAPEAKKPAAKEEKEEEEEEEEEEEGEPAQAAAKDGKKEEKAEEQEEDGEEKRRADGDKRRAADERKKYESREEAAGEREERTLRGAVAAAPSVRRMARELGMRIEQVRGSGPGGRISAEDVTAQARGLIAGGGAAAARPLPDFTKWGEVERRRMSAIRRATSEHLTAAWSTIPHVTQNDKADITELEKLRERFAKRVEHVGGKLTMTAIALKVAAAALRRFPQFGASLDVASEEIVYKQYIHIGVAVDTDRGLLVPVIRDVDKKSIAQLSAELSQVAERARNKKITLEEMEGGVFTITNLGGIGGTFFSPIINAPEVAILGIARAAQEAVYEDGQFQPRLMLPLSLSYDHRLIDGADAARFLRWFAEALEHPLLVLLES